MAAQLDPNVKDDLKTQFITREGTYRLMTLSEYSRPNRVGYTNSQSSPQVRVSIVTLPNPSGGIGGGNSLSNGPILTGGASSSAAAASNGSASNGAGGDGPQQSQYAAMGAGMSIQSMMNGAGGSVMDTQNGLGTVMGQYYGGDRICFNFGRELYVYAFRGVKKGSELSKPIDKKFYKGTNPSCHDFNAASATPSGAPLLVGFTTGQIQLVSPQPGPRELRKLYNEERLIDKTKVTCLKWLPNSPNLFLASHASGHLYLYNEELPCAPTAPNYQPFKLGDGYSILTCKSKSTRNPLYKWVFSTDNCCINEFCFSPCGSNLAIVSQDGFLRVFHYDTMELLGIARSYFGGFLCVCWSPDGKYIVVGGEDDLVTVWSLHERRVVARGQGHRSWVSVVAFDPYTTSYTNWDGGDFSDDENQMSEYAGAARFSADSTANGFDFMSNEKNSTPNHTRQRPQSASFRSDASSSAALAPDKLAISYRLGSVSQDTQLCLWDITEDVLRHPLALRQRVNSLNDSTHMNGGIDADGVKLLRPVAIGNVAPTLYPPNATSSPTKDTATTNNENSNSSSKHSSNSSSSKFSTANCTISSQSSSTTTPPEEASNAAATNNTIGKVNSSSNKSTGNAIKFPNCISAAKTDFVDGAAGNHMKHSSSSSTTSGYTSMSVSTTAAVPPANSKVSGGSNKSSDSGISTFNSLTQRLSNFSFLNNTSSDKKSSSLSFAADAHNSTSTHRNHRKATSILKSYGGGANSSHNNSLFANSATLDITGMGVNSTAHNFGSLKLGKSSTNSHSIAAAASNSIINSYDPMKLIGTSACPRFDECPLLEPLICKKIAHERLTALIFREDCFLTACQDGFIYTWARPGYTTTVPQHMSPSPSAPPGGTVV